MRTAMTIFNSTSPVSRSGSGKTKAVIPACRCEHESGDGATRPRPPCSGIRRSRCTCGSRRPRPIGARGCTPPRTPPAAVYASGIALSALYVAAVAGAYLWTLRHDGRVALSLFALLFVSSTLVHMLSHVMMRFRLPYVDPYLSLLAGTTAVSILRTIRGSRGDGSGAASVWRS
jgi:hypothetical protein